MTLPVGRIPGVGQVTEARMKELGIETVGIRKFATRVSDPCGDDSWVTFAFQFIHRNEAQRCGVDAIAKAAGPLWTIIEDVSQVTITMNRSYFCAAHTVGAVWPLGDVLCLNWFRETGPTAITVELVEGGEQRLAGHYVHVDSGLIMVPISILEGALSSILLSHRQVFGR